MSRVIRNRLRPGSMSTVERGAHFGYRTEKDAHESRVISAHKKTDSHTKLDYEQSTFWSCLFLFVLFVSFAMVESKRYH